MENKNINTENIDKKKAKDILGKEDLSKDELKELIEEINHFKKEKERVRSIVGNIGSMPSFDTKAFNIAFAVIIIGLLIASFLVVNDRIHAILSDIAIAAISIKIMYLIHNQARVNHFKLWVLSTMEWKVNEISKKVNKIEKKIDQLTKKNN